MKMGKLAQLAKESIIRILEILRLDQRTIDGFWFLAVEEAYGLERAVEFDNSVWKKMGRIVGLCKYSPRLRSLDTSIIDIKSATPVHLISLNEEEVIKGVQVIPKSNRINIPADNPLIKGLEQQGPLIAISNCGSHYVSSELSEDLVYKMIKEIAID